MPAHPRVPPGGAVRAHRTAPAWSRLRTLQPVEGCARNSEADYLRFLDIAYASTREVAYQLSPAARLGYLGQEPHSESTALCIETGKVLAGLIRALRK